MVLLKLNSTRESRRRTDRPGEKQKRATRLSPYPRPCIPMYLYTRSIFSIPRVDSAPTRSCVRNVENQTGVWACIGFYVLPYSREISIVRSTTKGYRQIVAVFVFSSFLRFLSFSPRGPPKHKRFLTCID